MATKTPILGLVLPAFEEFQDTWWQPINGNFSVIDSSLGGTQEEIQAARGSAANLNDRLSVNMNPDGSWIASPEMVDARDSSIYGDVNPLGNENSLDDRIEYVDREVFTARQELPALRDTLANYSNTGVGNCIVSAPTGYLSFTGAQVKVDGSITNVVANINGYRQVVRNLKSTTISGAAGTYFITLNRNASGETYLDRTGTGQNTGSISVYSVTSKLQQFVDITQNFITLGVKPGDLLNITSVSSPNTNTYVVSSVIDPTTLIIIGLFFTAQTSLNYNMVNPIAPSVGFTATAPSKRFQVASGLIYIGRAVFDGTNITSVFSYQVVGKFEQFFSITLTGGNFEQTISHQLGYVPTHLEVYGSQTNDYSSTLDPLSVTGSGATSSSTLVPVGQQLATFVSGTTWQLAASPMSASSTSIDVDGVPAIGNWTLSANQIIFNTTPPISTAKVTASYYTSTTTTAANLTRSVLVDVTDTTIRVKNSANGIFYQDYSGVSHTTGYLLVRAER